jgi:hypothetical protein
MEGILERKFVSSSIWAWSLFTDFPDVVVSVVRRPRASAALLSNVT